MSALIAALALTFLVCVAALALVTLVVLGRFAARHTLWLLEQWRAQRRRARVRSIS